MLISVSDYSTIGVLTMICLPLESSFFSRDTSLPSISKSHLSNIMLVSQSFTHTLIPVHASLFFISTPLPFIFPSIFGESHIVSCSHLVISHREAG